MPSTGRRAIRTTALASRLRVTDPTGRTQTMGLDNQGYLQEIDGYDPAIKSTFTLRWFRPAGEYHELPGRLHRDPGVRRNGWQPVGDTEPADHGDVPGRKLYGGGLYEPGHRVAARPGRKLDASADQQVAAVGGEY